MLHKFSGTKNVYVISVLARICILLVGFLYSILLARYLGAELRGQLSVINTITAITVIVFSAGIHQAYPYYKKNGMPNIGAVYNHICLILLLIHSMLSVFAAYIVHVHSTDIRVVIATLMTPLLVYTKLVTYQAMIEDPNRKNLFEVVCELVEVIFLLFLLLFFKRNLYYALAVIIFKNILACAYYMRLLNFDFHIRLSDFAFLKNFFIFGFFPMLALLMNNLNYRIDVLMLERSVSDAQIGIYTIGIQIAEKVWLVSEAMRDVLFSKLVGGKDSEEVNKVIRLCFTISIVVVLGIVLLGKPFIYVCFGREYVGAYTPLVIVLFGSLMMVFYKIIQAFNVIHKKQNLNFWFLLIAVIVNIVMNLWLIPIMGINGAAAASLVSYVVCALLFIVEYLCSTSGNLKDLIVINQKDLKILKSLIKRN